MKTFNKFLEEVKPPEPQEEDPQIKSKEKRQMQIKKQVLLKKMQAVRAGAGADYGKSGYVSKDNPRKPQTAAEKKKVRAHQAKVDKENAAARAKDPSQGRYPKG